MRVVNAASQHANGSRYSKALSRALPEIHSTRAVAHVYFYVTAAHARVEFSSSASVMKRVTFSTKSRFGALRRQVAEQDRRCTV
jgi:hypothetical protein